MLPTSRAGHAAALLTLKANWFGALTVKQWEIMINNKVVLFSLTNEETPYEQLLHYLSHAVDISSFPGPWEITRDEANDSRKGEKRRTIDPPSFAPNYGRGLGEPRTGWRKGSYFLYIYGSITVNITNKCNLKIQKKLWLSLTAHGLTPVEFGNLLFECASSRSATA